MLLVQFVILLLSALFVRWNPYPNPVAALSADGFTTKLLKITWSAPLNLITALSALDGIELEDADAQTGVNILRKALTAPMRKIAENAGQNGDVIIQNVLRAQAEQGDNKIGYDVISGQLVHMIDAGIIDPAKVTRGALENAASIASMILTTEALITDIPSEGGNDHGAPSMGGGMGF